MLVEKKKSLMKEIYQTGIRSELKVICKKVLESHVVCHSGGWLEVLLVKKKQKELKDHVLGHIHNWMPGQKMLEDFPA